MTTKERLLSKLSNTDDPDACWEFQGHRSSKNYGRIKNSAGSTVNAQRVAYEELGKRKRKIPTGSGVLHHCDNPPCCNPAHLYTGTQKENVRDCINRQRRFVARGAEVCGSKLTVKKVLSIRASGLETRFLAAKYAVSRITIQKIRSRKTWKHI